MIDLISYAFDSENNLVFSSDAVKGINYFCPCCSKPFIFRKGKIKRPHFAHKSDSNCSSESIFHKTAKLLIQKSILDFLHNGGERPSFFRKCSDCFSNGHRQRFNDIFDDVLLEFRLPSGFILDVALMSKGRCLAGIEVFYTHKVDDYKSHYLEVPFIEVKASSIISNPLIFDATHKSLKDTFPAFLSNSCFEKREQIKEKELFSKIERAAISDYLFSRHIGTSFPSVSYYQSEKDFLNARSDYLNRFRDFYFSSSKTKM
jgi:hypothetical protein